MNETFINVKCYKLSYRFIEKAHKEKEIMRAHKTKSEFECLMLTRDLGKYVGKWIAIVDEEIVSIGDAGKQVFKEAKQKHPRKTPFVVKIPSSSVMLL